MDNKESHNIFEGVLLILHRESHATLKGFSLHDCITYEYISIQRSSYDNIIDPHNTWLCNTNSHPKGLQPYLGKVAKIPIKTS